VAAVVVATAAGACTTPRAEPVTLGPAEVARVARDHEWGFTVGTVGILDGETLSVRIVGPVACPRGEKLENKDAPPAYTFEKDRCDEDGGERMLASVDALGIVISEPGVRADPKWLEVPPSVTHVNVPVAIVDDALTAAMDPSTARDVLRGTKWVKLVARGTLVHREQHRTFDYGAFTVDVAAIDAPLLARAQRAARTKLPPGDVLLVGTPTAGSGDVVTDVLPRDDSAGFIASIKERCGAGARPLLAAPARIESSDRILVVYEPAVEGIRVVCDIVEGAPAALSALVAARGDREVAAAVVFDDKAVVVLVGDE
jgi:hypothetical protein